MNDFKRAAFPLKVVFTVLLVFGIATVAMFFYRNYYLEDYTSKSIGTLSKYVKGSTIKDFRNVINADSIEDITYKYDPLLKVYTIYFGDYAIYLADDDSSWSPDSLEVELGNIGITFEHKEGYTVFYFGGEEISTSDWQK